MLRRFIFAIVLSPFALAQNAIQQGLDRLTTSPTDHDALQTLSGTYDVRVVDAYKRSFDTATDPEDKALIAYNLVDDGVKDPKYIDYLIQRATAEIQNDAPYPMARDAEGKEARGKADPAFEEWCRNHQRDLGACATDYLYPRTITMLAMLGDPRAGDVLLQGLRSKNLPAFVFSAGGLAVLGRKDALPLIAERIATVPPNIAVTVVSMLGPYHDARADALIDLYVSDKASREKIKEGPGLGTLLQRRKERGIQ